MKKPRQRTKSTSQGLWAGFEGAASGPAVDAPALFVEPAAPGCGVVMRWSPYVSGSPSQLVRADVVDDITYR
jgi:hypothetical protein